jgi:hypothetical protein
MASNPATASQLNNPQALLSSQAQADLMKLFSQFGNQAQSLFDSFMSAVRHSLEFAISDLFFLAMIISAVGFVVVLFLKEVPLRRSHGLEEKDESES